MALGRSTKILLSSLLLTGFSPPALAEPQRPPPALRSRGAVEVLADMDRPASRSDWLALQLRHVDLNGKYGLIYSREVDVGERGLELRLRGPALGRQRRFGLSFEARF